MQKLKLMMGAVALLSVTSVACSKSEETPEKNEGENPSATQAAASPRGPLKAPVKCTQDDEEFVKAEECLREGAQFLTKENEVYIMVAKTTKGEIEAREKGAADDAPLKTLQPEDLTVAVFAIEGFDRFRIGQLALGSNKLDFMVHGIYADGRVSLKEEDFLRRVGFQDIRDLHPAMPVVHINEGVTVVDKNDKTYKIQELYEDQRMKVVTDWGSVSIKKASELDYQVAYFLDFQQGRRVLDGKNKEHTVLRVFSDGRAEVRTDWGSESFKKVGELEHLMPFETIPYKAGAHVITSKDKEFTIQEVYSKGTFQVVTEWGSQRYHHESELAIEVDSYKGLRASDTVLDNDDTKFSVIRVYSNGRAKVRTEWGSERFKDRAELSKQIH